MFFRAHRNSGIYRPFPAFGAQVSFGLFAAAVLAVGWYAGEAQYISDESAYNFQARVFLSGHLTAEALPGASGTASTPKEIYFEHHIFHRSRWFVKYAWGWPALLACGTAFRAGWLVNPLLGLVLLLLMHSMAKLLFDSDTGKLTILFAVLSPYYLANCIGTLSHTLSAVLTLMAFRFWWRYIRTQNDRLLILSLFCTVILAHVRLFTGVVVFLWLVGGTCYCLRNDRRRLPSALVTVALVGAILAVSVGTYNALYTGNWARSPYALAANVGIPQEVSLDPRAILAHNYVTRRALQQTVVFSFPLLFVLAVIGARKEWQQDAVRVLSAGFPLIVAAYMVQTDTSTSLYGERYYFELFFTLLLLGARGFVLLIRNWRISSTPVYAALLTVAVMQGATHVAATRIIADRTEPYRLIKLAVGALPSIPLAVFLREPGITPKHLNLNASDWRNSPTVFLNDPGPNGRAEWACRVGRRQWVVIGLDPDQQHTETLYAGTDCNH
jgi:hypothetical protein